MKNHESGVTIVISLITLVKRVGSYTKNLQNWKNRGEKSGREVPTPNEADASSFTKEQMKHLSKLLKFNSTSSDFPKASMAHTCIGSKALFNSFMSN